MEHTSYWKIGSPKHLFFVLALTILTVVAMVPSTAIAQKIVVPTFSSRGAGKLAYRARIRMLRSLKNQGVSLVPYKQYLSRAKRLRLRGRKALSPNGIARLARIMGLDGVVTGRAWRAGKRFRLRIKAYDASGKLIVSKTYRFRWQALPASNARRLAKAIASKLGGSKPAEDFDLSEPVPVVEAPTTDLDTTSNVSDDALPAWSRTQDSVAKSQSQPVKEPINDPAIVERKTSIGRKTIGSVPDILLSAGMSGNLRSGLKPAHESSIYPGLRVDARIFLRSIIDSSVIGNLALGGMLNNGFALKYGLEGEEEEWDSSMRQWQAELTYRFKIDDVALQPAFLLRLGYGSTVNTIDSDDEAAISAGYKYPYSALDIYITLWKPYVRLFGGGGFLYPVSLSEELDGTGWGINVRGGLDIVLFGNLHTGIGYEMWKFMGMKVGDEDISDTFQSFFLRIGWSYQ